MTSNITFVPACENGSLLEALPKEMLGTIISYLPTVTGSLGVVNEKDIPVTFRYLFHLAATCKRLYHTVHDIHVMQRFCDSLEQKYNKPSIHYAALLNTKTTRALIWRYIKDNKLDEDYQVIQDIYTLAANVLCEAKEAGIDFNCTEGRKDWPSPNPFYHQTKSGFLLNIGLKPDSLGTPFGEIQIYGGGGYSDYAPLSVAELFINRLNAQFDRSASDRHWSAMREVANPKSSKIRRIDAQEVRKIPSDTIPDEIGNQNLYFYTYCGNRTAYRITQVAGRTLPEVTHHETRDAVRSYELVNLMWKLLESHRLGKDPIEMEKSRKIVKSPSRKKDPDFKSLDEIAPWCAEKTVQLARQPFYEGETSVNLLIKILPLENYSLALLLETLNNLAEDYLGKKKITLIALMRGHLYESKLGPGVQCIVDYADEQPLCSIRPYQIAYLSILDRIGWHWTPAKLHEYPDILLTESEEDYLLFIKKEPQNRLESVLIKRLALHLGISKYISCDNEWKGHQYRDTDHPIYLWIKKEHAAHVRDLLHIKEL